MVVQHNLIASNNNRQLNLVSNELSSSAKKLSSGYKINVAADDAAGLSISEKMRKQIRGLTKASANAEDGISLIQVADGALTEVHDMLQRMNELSIQSANGTNSDSDREAIQNEVSALKTEIDRVSATTKFNETYIFEGYQKSNVGNSNSANNAGVYPLIYCSDSSVSLDELEARIVAEPYANNFTSESDIKLANTLKNSIVPQAVKSFMDNYSAFSYLEDESIQMGLNLVNDNSSSALASVACVNSSGYQSFMLTVNTAYLDFDAEGNLTDESRTNLEATISHEMMHAFMFETLPMGLCSSDSYPLWFIEGMAQTACGGCYNGNDWVNGTLALNASSSIDDIKATLTNSSKKIGSNTNASNYGTGYLACMYLAYEAGTGNSLINKTANGLNQILGRLMNGHSLDETISYFTDYSGLNDFINNFGSNNKEAAYVSKLLGIAGTEGSGGILTGFTSVDGIFDDDVLQGIDLFSLNTDTQLVSNYYDDSTHGYYGGSATKTGKSYDIALGYSSKLGKNMKQISLHIGSDADMTNKLSLHVDAMDSESIGISNIDVSTKYGSTLAINATSIAIAKVSKQRSLLGACQNRLEHTIKNLDNVVENTTSSESQIRDTDMALEMVKYSNYNILAQAGQSLLAQTNQSNQSVLSLVS